MVMAFFDLINTASKDALAVYYTVNHSNDKTERCDFIRNLTLNIYIHISLKYTGSIPAKIKQVTLFAGIQDILYWSKEHNHKESADDLCTVCEKHKSI
jgi:hypothetical protein